MILEEVKNIIEEVIEIDVSNVTMDTELVKDLELESLDVVDLVGAFEKKYQIIINDKDIKHLQTIGDIVKYIESKINV